MAAFDIVRQRLRSQRAVAPKFGRPAEVVAWLCAVQAQDYRGSLWGIGLRTAGATEPDVERAIEDRTIVRTWPMRGTLHFVAADDVRWMLRLLTPRIALRSAGRNRQLTLDAAIFAQSRACLEKALSGGRALTRPETYRVLEQAGITTHDQRGIHILMHLAMQGVLCLGARQGRQPTFVLLDDWIPSSRILERDEALGELARRYFTSHGPATARDFAWWSGLSLGDARRAVDVSMRAAGSTLTEHVVGESAYWSAPSRLAPRRTTRLTTVAHLLPAFDEYTVAYCDRSALLDPVHAVRARNGIFSPVVLIDGRIVGTWRRQTKRDHVLLATDLFERPTRAVRGALEVAAERYGDFLGVRAAIACSG
jgi:hypothetical protein